MRHKVIATYYVDANTWIEAENQVEQKLAEADQIESEPSSKNPRDMIGYALATKIYDRHNKIFFERSILDNYDDDLEALKKETLHWLENILDEVISTNESSWV